MKLLVSILSLGLVPNVFGIWHRSDVTFYLFTESDRKNGVRLQETNLTIDEKAPVVFLIHGWYEHRLLSWYENLKNAFLSQPGKASVIQVDWSKPATQFYPTAVSDCSKIGKIIADLIINLMGNHGVPARNVHLCGHSLGGHIAGFAGKFVQKGTSQKLARITALDPAGVLFQGIFTTDARRLSRNDADVVVVLHTDVLKFGYSASCGSVDVYANLGDLVQPGCPDAAGGSWYSCSHQRSHQFFIDALEHPGTLVATRCWSLIAYKFGWCSGNRKVDLGGEIDVQDDGDYYLTTRFKKPYGLGARR